ncbi:hypothetical protein Hypma_006626 [Hypsizygus marmoreus]|uniref:Uncharacterized protein n=1 Tax=Hypsizygus marmoreus TaxID=39966 RepID=A0A369K1W4_HYPMA|nr:hypothetical protein Hypma_006626 [Hypsizygus marmoreus]
MEYEKSKGLGRIARLWVGGAQISYVRVCKGFPSLKFDRMREKHASRFAIESRLRSNWLLLGITYGHRCADLRAAGGTNAPSQYIMVIGKRGQCTDESSLRTTGSRDVL